MQIKELLKRDYDIEIKISGGTGRSDDPYVGSLSIRVVDFQALIG